MECMSDDTRNPPAPLIGVTGPDGGPRPAWHFTRLALCLAGARAVRLRASRADLPEPLDGLVIGGGDDIDPAMYAGDDTGRAPRDPKRDAFEKRMIEQAVEQGLPMLGICRGAQLINVVMGGDLHGDVRPMRRRTSNRRHLTARKVVKVRRGSRLGAITRRRAMRVNSLHEQAVRRLGRGLRVVSRDRDRIVQAIEGTGRQFVLGVQWHPEYLPCLRAQRRLFAGLVRAARKRSG